MENATLNLTKWKPMHETAAIAAGFWFAKDHGRWFIGHGVSRLAANPPDGYKTRGEARKAMAAAYLAVT